MAQSPSTGAAQPDNEAASRHNPSPTGGLDAGGPAERAPLGAPASADFEFEGSKNSGRERDRPAGGSSAQHPHVFHLANSAPEMFEGGTLQGATQDVWKLLEGQQGSAYLARLKPGGIREPHWHPSAWEMNFIISGRSRWSFVGPEGTHDSFEAVMGDLIFAPQGHYHYFENVSETEDLVALLVFNTSASEPRDDIGIVASLSAIPPGTLAAIFKTSPEAFRNLPRKLERVTIARHPTEKPD
jgi:oxalate decarboxylase